MISTMFARWIALAIAVLLLVAFALISKRARLTLIARLPLALLVIIVFAVAIALAACSALSGLTGSTSSTPVNPTGAPLSSDTLSISTPSQATVAANCAKGDANSCKQLATVAAFCKSNTSVQEVLKPCTDNGWMSQ